MKRMPSAKAQPNISNIPNIFCMINTHCVGWEVLLFDLPNQAVFWFANSAEFSPLRANKSAWIPVLRFYVISARADKPGCCN